MKKITILLLFVGMYGTVLAQSDLYYGAKAGLNFTSLVGEGSSESAKMKIGYHFGVLGRMNLNEAFGVQAEMLFSNQGARLSDSELSPESGRRQVLTYLNIPLLIRYGINENLTFEAGPQFGFLLSAKRKWDEMEIDLPPGVPQYYTRQKNKTVETGRLQSPASTMGASAHESSGSGKEDIKAFVNGVNIDLSFGLDYKLPYNLSAYLRYNLGLSDVYKTSSEVTRHSVFSLGVSYIFNNGIKF